MKTNHRRNFVARNDGIHRSFEYKDNLPTKGSPMEVRVGACINHGGKRQEAHMIHGAKQYVHTRTRRREDAVLYKTLKHMENEDESS